MGGAFLGICWELWGWLANTGAAIAVHSSGNVYVTNSTDSTDFPIVGAIFQAQYGGGNDDAFVTELNSDGSALVYSTFLGGSNTDSGYGIAVDTATPPSAYVAGQTCSLDFPLANPLQPTYGANCDAFISKVSILQGIALNPAGLLFQTQSLGTSSPQQTVTLTNGDNTPTISGFSITGPDSGDFSVSSNCPTGSPLAAGKQCQVYVTFTPAAPGIRKASKIETGNSKLENRHIRVVTKSLPNFDFPVSIFEFPFWIFRTSNQPVAECCINIEEEARSILCRFSL